MWNDVEGVAMSEEKCYKCGARIITYTVPFNEGNYYTLKFCSNPRCDVIVPVEAKGRIPFEIAIKHFPGHEEVF